MLFPIKNHAIINMAEKDFLRQFSNYSQGDRVSMSHSNMIAGKGVFGGSVLSIGPVGQQGAQFDSTATNVDLLQRPEDYRASTGIMKEIIQANVSGYNKRQNDLIPQVEAVTKSQKIAREIGSRKRRAKAQQASKESIVMDYNKLKTKSNKMKFIESLGNVYKADPENSKYILEGIEMVKAK